MLPNHIRAILTQHLPEDIIKDREQAGTVLKYISGSTAEGILNQAFGFDWDWEVEREWIEPSQPRVNKYKNNEPEPQPPVAHVKGVLIVRYVDDKGNNKQIRKVAYGSKVINGGAYEQDGIYKAASTDALKKAATLLGVALQLYRDPKEIAYFRAIDYVDPWTNELKDKHEESFVYIESFKSNFEKPEEALNQYIYAFSNGAGYDMQFITPMNIQNFVAYCKSALG